MILSDCWMLPDGIEEIMPEEAFRLESLRRKYLDLFFSWGYQLVIPPMVEFIEPLLTGSGSELDHKTFKVIDQKSGRLLGLRADITPQVSRIDARAFSGNTPARLCYVGTILHTYSDNLSRSRDPLQIGAEIYGHSGIYSDIEVLRLMLNALRLAGFPEVHLDLGHVGVFRGLANQAKLTQDQENELFGILQRKAGPELKEFLSLHVSDTGLMLMFESLLELNGGYDILDIARTHLNCASDNVLSAVIDVAKIANVLQRDFPELRINFDFAELRGYHYQTGVVFAAFVPGFGREVARGGRYDEVGKVFGRARPATGFSADLKLLSRLASAARSMNNVPRIFAPASEEEGLMKRIAELRGSGQVVVQELIGQSNSLSDLGCTHELVRRGADWKLMPV